MRCFKLTPCSTMLFTLLLLLPMIEEASGEDNLKLAEKSLSRIMEKLAFANTGVEGLQTSWQVTISEPRAAPLFYQFKVSLKTGKRFRFDLLKSPHGPLTVGAPGNGSLWINMPQEELVVITHMDQLKHVPGQNVSDQIRDWVLSLREEVRLEKARSTISEAVVFLPRHPDSAEVSDIKRVVLWVNRNTDLPRRLLVYDRGYKIKASAETLAEWQHNPALPEDFFSPPSGKHTRHIGIETFFEGLSLEEQLFEEAN